MDRRKARERGNRRDGALKPRIRALPPTSVYGYVMCTKHARRGSCALSGVARARRRRLPCVDVLERI